MPTTRNQKRKGSLVMWPAKPGDDSMKPNENQRKERSICYTVSPLTFWTEDRVEAEPDQSVDL
jgi:hypothetical protein